MQDLTETSASSISLGSCQEYYRDLPDQFHLDLLGESSTSFTSTESDDTDNNHPTRKLKSAAPNTMLPLTSTPPRVARSFKEFEHSTLTPVTLATTFAVSSSSLDDNDIYKELPVPPLNVSHSLPPSCPPEQLQVQLVGTVPVPLEVEDTDCSQCRIKVAIRLRPLESQEFVQPRRPRRGGFLGDTRAWSLGPEEATPKANSGRCGSGSTLFQKGASRRTPGRTDFSFDAVFDENVRTLQVYQDIARPIVKGVASGRHGTIFSYGQTGMGKTFTMQGCGNSVDTGIIQMAAVDLFRMIESSSSQREYVVKAQYFEIYNEQIRDLLPKTTTTSERTNSFLELPLLSAQEDTITQNVHVNAHEEKVSGVDDVCRLLSQGNRNRACAVTNLNAQSSRSHAIFRLVLESRELPDDQTDQTMRVSVLNMVDLAGSENSQKAGVTGLRKREGGKINQSLLSLSRVIHALSLPVKKRPKHISFRDAKLTRILQPHLLGNACMAILCCVSASSLHLEETRSTLRFAASAKLIEMKPTVNEVVDHQSVLKKLQIELAETKDALHKLQIRSDVNDSKGQSVSVVPVSDALLSMSKPESMRIDLPTESGSAEDGLGHIIEDPQGMTLQTPILGDSESKPEEVPPISEVWFSMGSAHKKCCGDLTTRLVQTEKRSKYLEEKLEATNDLVRTLVCELEKARRNNVDCNQGSRASKDRFGALEEQDGMSNDGEFAVMRRQYLQMKFAIYACLLFYTLGQTEKFVAALIFFWLSQELVN